MATTFLLKTDGVPSPEGIAGAGSGYLLLQSGGKIILQQSVSTGLIEEAIEERVLSVKAIRDFIGTRIYPDSLPKDVRYPTIRYFRVADPLEAMTQDGGPSSLGHSRFRLEALAEKKIDTVLLALQLVFAFDGYKGRSAGVLIQATFQTDRSSVYEEPLNVYSQSIELDFWYTQVIE